MWEIKKNMITVELAKFVLETFNHYQMKDTLGLFNGGRYVTYTDDVKFCLHIHENNFILLFNQHRVMILQGPAHLINDKLRDMYPVLKDP